MPQKTCYRSFFIYFLAAFLPLLSFSQINPVNISYKQALKQAKEEGKFLFIICNPDCVICKDMFLKKTADSALGDLISKNFIIISLRKDDPDYYSLTDKFETINATGILFTDSKGYLLNKLRSANYTVKTYTEACNKAIRNKPCIDTIELYNSEFNKGNRSLDFLVNYIRLVQQTGAETNNLLDEYVSLLPKDSLTNSLPAISFIASYCPVINSRAHKWMYTNKISFNEAWWRFSKKQRSEINSTTIEKSIRKAIKEKNDGYAIKVIRGYTEGNSINKSRSARMRYSMYLADYYWAVKDTVAYKSEARNYIDNYITTADLDSISKIEEKPATAEETNYTEADSIIPVSLAKSYSQTLNKHAWRFYKVSNNTTELRKASYWSLKSVELDDRNSAAWDTYARLLYRLGDKQQAIDAEEKALAIMKEKGYFNSVKEFEKALKNMRSGKTEID